MTMSDLDVPVTVLDGRSGSVCLRSPFTGEVTLTVPELCDLAAAIELDRVQRPDVTRVLSAKRERRVRPGQWWALLMDGALGLQRSDAPGEITVAAALSRVGVEILRHDVERPVDMGEVRQGLRAIGGGR